jgi:hypothetical protein
VKRPRQKWEKQTLKLQGRHFWTAQPGCKVFVADRGAVRFDFPQDWMVVPDSDSIKLHDKPPPDDDCVLAVSYMRLPPIDWSGLPLSSLVEQTSKGDSRPIYEWGEIIESRRADLEIAWREMRFIDPVEKREAFSRFCLARRGRVQAIISFDFWETDYKRCEGVWEIVLKSLELDEQIADPTVGRVVH